MKNVSYAIEQIRSAILAADKEVNQELDNLAVDGSDLESAIMTAGTLHMLRAHLANLLLPRLNEAVMLCGRLNVEDPDLATETAAPMLDTNGKDRVLAALASYLPADGSYLGISYDILCEALPGLTREAVTNVVSRLSVEGVLLRKRRTGTERTYGSRYVFALAPANVEPTQPAETSTIAEPAVLPAPPAVVLVDVVPTAAIADSDSTTGADIDSETGLPF